MSVSKLLSRIVAHSSDRIDTCKCVASSLHDHTYGITSDPLTQFACILSALIHDADHVGVPNTQLVKEETETAKRYKGKSVAEQNSVVLSWEMLLRPEYCDLRGAIAATDAEWTRLKQLVVNSVMATDIMDKDLKGLRNVRWEKAFSEQDPSEDAHVTTNRKATIVIEHLIQASDVAHTMQHWHVYRKWNQRLFEEMYKAYKEGRSEKDPSEFWYKGETGFFDFYIIPLAKKLKDCGVFGVASDEYLTYAIQNRREWEERGEAVVDEMIEKVKAVWEEEAETTDTFVDEASVSL
ncbi:calmodulin-dependent 3',5'-cyclic nucleotide phosphodiesterase 1C [Seminavis robusta]|uniref:Calmodulin-dependent 3',5'-cyclic nucleotide phosphodiesterase 1C n=1 Tax=Seminavis robusta TaxID=568900 RepID=A0A9N8H3S2_9STRA|nr:calmodulin-dependent 3',5'-cyclic nucleotide phosphodiesterase 1C [Seminavis robusta]|eukprot:Sro68_g037830.1 calmodulin-dependent 3',5'-cyclic nucleotide phosphodiesterase 1C (294) ;mRNA; f:41-1098